MTARIDLGPLTTVFTPPSACSTAHANIYNNDQYEYDLAPSCSPTGTDYQLAINAECYPSALSAIAANPYPSYFENVAFFSPGLMCPQGYAPACTVTRDAAAPVTSAQSVIWEYLKAGETAVGCCPSGWECANDYFYRCYLTPTKGFVYSGISYGSACAETVSTTITISAAQTTPVGVAERVNLILPSGTQSGLITPGPQMPTMAGTNKSSGLPTGAKIGIGVGVPIAVLAFVAGLFFFLRRKKRARRATGVNSKVDGGSVTHDSHEPSHTTTDNNSHRLYELEPNRLGELEAKVPTVVELSDNSAPVMTQRWQSSNFIPQQSNHTDYQSDSQQISSTYNDPRAPQPYSTPAVATEQHSTAAASIPRPSVDTNAAYPDKVSASQVTQPSSTQQTNDPSKVSSAVNSLAVMKTYNQLKDMKAAKNRRAADLKSSLPLVQGSYGRFPSTFSIHLGGTQADNSSTLFYLTSLDGVRFMAYTAYDGNGGRFFTLHSSAETSSPPLAWADNDGGRFKSSKTMTLPAPQGSSGEWKGRLQDRGSLRRSVFTLENISGANLQSSHETLEWRSGGFRQNPVVHELKRVGKRGDQSSELIATFREERIGIGKVVAPGETKLGEVQFFLSPEELGPHVYLQAAVSAVCICHIQAIARLGAARLADAAAAVASAGVMVGVRA